VFALRSIVGCINVKVALFIVLEHENPEDELAMLLQESLHRGAVVEKLLNNAQHFVSVFEVRCEKIDVQDEVNEWDACRQMELLN
jgi:hypothetical protein